MQRKSRKLNFVKYSINIIMAMLIVYFVKNQVYASSELLPETNTQSSITKTIEDEEFSESEIELPDSTSEDKNKTTEDEKDLVEDEDLIEIETSVSEVEEIIVIDGTDAEKDSLKVEDDEIISTQESAITINDEQPENPLPTIVPGINIINNVAYVYDENLKLVVDSWYKTPDGKETYANSNGEAAINKILDLKDGRYAFNKDGYLAKGEWIKNEGLC